MQDEKIEHGDEDCGDGRVEHGVVQDDVNDEVPEMQQIDRRQERPVERDEKADRKPVCFEKAGSLSAATFPPRSR